MFCKYCGAILDDDALFCEKCGARVSGGKVLYSAADEDSSRFEVGMMNTDGTEAVTVIKADEEILSFDTDGKELLYLAGDRLRSCTLDGKNDAELLTDVKCFVSAGNTLYYSSSDGIYSYVKKTKKSTKISDGEGEELCFTDGKLYYKKDASFYMTDEEGKEKKLITDKFVHYMMYWKDHIYFVRMFSVDELEKYLGEDWEDTTSLYLVGVGNVLRIPPEGGAEEVIGVDVLDDSILATTVFGYPEGMYTRLSLVLNVLDPVEKLPAD